MAGEFNVALEEVAELIRGVSYRPDELLDDRSDGVPLLRATNIGDGTLDFTNVYYVPSRLVAETQYLRRFDVVIAMSSGSQQAVGRLAQLRESWRGCVGAFCAVKRPDPRRVDPEYLGYVLRSPEFRTHIESHAVGTAIMNLSRGRILGFSLRLPTPAEQHAIAHILGTLDDKIELNRRMSETLEQMARAIFKAWFVDFEPVRAKMEGRWRRGESLPGLPAHLYDLFPDRLVDSELGQIPEGWEVGTVYEIADVIYGAPFSSSHFNSEGIGEPLLRIRDLPTESPSVYTTELHPKGYKVRPGDVVVGMDGEFRAYLWGGQEAWLNQIICVFKPKSGASAAFVRNAIMQPLADVEWTETGTTVIHLGKGDIDRFQLVLPRQDVLTQFNKICQPWYDRIVAVKQESHTLAALRDALLPKLISGERRVKDVERFIKRIGI